MNEEKELPRGWEWVELGDLVADPKKDLVDGPFGSNLKAAEYVGTGVPVLRIQNIKANRFVNSNINHITEQKATQLSRHSFVSGDLIVTKLGDPLGLCCKVPTIYASGIIVADLMRLRPDRGIVFDQFLAFAINSTVVQDQFKEVTKGTTRPRVNLTIVRRIRLPLPPLAEQHRIVAKIDELFSSLDKGIENLKTAQQQLKIYRQAVLQAAFSGKLTEEFRKSSGAEMGACLPCLPAGMAAGRFEGRLTNENVVDEELPRGWSWTNSGNLFRFVTSGSRGWAKYYSNSGAVFIRITNLDFDSLELDLEESKIQYVNPPLGAEGMRTRVMEGDFLFSITGYLGMFAIAPHLENAFINQHIALCRPKEGFSRKYIGYWITSRTGGYYYLNKKTKGATKAGLGLDDIKNFPVPLPPLPEQHRIVAEIESRLSVADNVEETINDALKQAESLRQSILKRAFEGKLVPQDPNDLPAPRPGLWFVYVLECDDGSYYKGFTKDILERWKQHASGKGAEWTAKHPPRRLVHWEEFSSESAAVEREKELKTGYGRKWLEREIEAGRTRQAGEPASVLLARIKAERENVKAEPGPPRRVPRRKARA